MNALALRFFLCGLTMSAATLLALMLLPVLRKYVRPRWLYAALLLIVVGFIVPFRLPMPWNVHIEPVSVEVMPTIAPLPSSYSTLSPATQDTQSLTSIGAGSVPVFEGPSQSISVLPTLPVIWAIGGLMYCLYASMRHLRFARNIRRWQQSVQSPAVVDAFNTLKSSLRIRRSIRLMQSPVLDTPILFGLFRPTVVLPEAALDDARLPFMLQHELIHYRHGDLWVKVLTTLCTALHWYNPLAHLLARACALQCEMACDEAVLKRTHTDLHLDYGEAILHATRRTSPRHFTLSTHFTGGTQPMKKRIAMLAPQHFNRFAGLVVTLSVLLLIALGGIALAQPLQTPAPTATPDPFATPYLLPFETMPPAYPQPADTPTPKRTIADLTAFGLSVDAYGHIHYDGQQVRMLCNDKNDLQAGFFWDKDGGDIDLYMLYDSKGNVIDLAVYTQAEYDQNTSQYTLLLQEASPLQYHDGTTTDHGYQQALIALQNYLNTWGNQDYEAMVAFAAPYWLAANSHPQQSLYWNHNFWVYEDADIRLLSQNVDEVFFEVDAYLRKSNVDRTPVTMRYEARTVQENGVWFVDPESMKTGAVIEEAASAPAPDTPLWYNSLGGRNYHTDEQCSAVQAVYWPDMAAFSYQALDSEPYAHLLPCEICGAPARP